MLRLTLLYTPLDQLSRHQPPRVFSWPRSQWTLFLARPYHREVAVGVIHKPVESFGLSPSSTKEYHPKLSLLSRASHSCQ